MQIFKQKARNLGNSRSVAAAADEKKHKTESLSARDEINSSLEEMHSVPRNFMKKLLFWEERWRKYVRESFIEKFSFTSVVSESKEFVTNCILRLRANFLKVQRV